MKVRRFEMRVLTRPFEIHPPMDDTHIVELDDRLGEPRTFDGVFGYSLDGSSIGFGRSLEEAVDNATDVWVQYGSNEAQMRILAR